MNFPEKLKQLRIDQGLTQEELANKIFVSRTLISKYENGFISPSKENAEKLATYFNVKLSYLIDSDDTVELVLKNKTLDYKINLILSYLIVTILVISLIFFLVPCLKIRYYEYSNTPPIALYKFDSPINLTLKNNNPIIIFTIISLIINCVLTFLRFSYKNNKMLKISNYVLFVISLILIFVSIIFSLKYSSNILYDHKVYYTI